MLKRVWTDLVEPVGRAGRQGGGRERGGGRSVARGGGKRGRRRRLRCVGGVAVVAGRGRLVDGGGGGKAQSWSTVQCSAVQCSSHERRREATARRRLRPSDRSQAGRGVGRGGGCVVRACRARAASAQRAGGRGAAAGQRSSSKLAATQSTARTHAGSGQSGSLVEYRLHPFTRSRSRLVGVWQCNFSPAGRLAVSSAAPVDSRRIPVVLVLAAAALPKKPPD